MFLFLRLFVFMNVPLSAIANALLRNRYPKKFENEYPGFKTQWKQFTCLSTQTSLRSLVPQYESLSSLSSLATS